MRRPESGFSLIELLIAMVVTLVITGAVYGLLAGGQNAFRREPALTDRQQNIRSAMNSIGKDAQFAGMEMGTFFQTFTRGLDAKGPDGLASKSDFLELFGNDGTCPSVHIKDTDGSNVDTGKDTGADKIDTNCYPEPGPVLVFFKNGQARWGWGHNIHANDTKLNFPPGQQPDTSQIQKVEDLTCYLPPDAPNSAKCDNANPNIPVALGLLQFVRYEIANDPTDGVPNLYRSTTGGLGGDENYDAAPSAAGGWQVVARGIEDMQVEYKNGLGVWQNDPGAVACAYPCTAPTVADYNTIVREIKVTLSARSAAPNIQGMTKVGSLPAAMRGSLTTVFVPRAATQALTWWPEKSGVEGVPSVPRPTPSPGGFPTWE